MWSRWRWKVLGGLCRSINYSCSVATWGCLCSKKASSASVHHWWAVWPRFTQWRCFIKLQIDEKVVIWGQQIVDPAMWKLGHKKEVWTGLQHKLNSQESRSDAVERILSRRRPDLIKTHVKCSFESRRVWQKKEAVAVGCSCNKRMRQCGVRQLNREEFFFFQIFFRIWKETSWVLDTSCLSRATMLCPACSCFSRAFGHSQYRKSKWFGHRGVCRTSCMEIGHHTIYSVPLKVRCSF